MIIKGDEYNLDDASDKFIDDFLSVIDDLQDSSSDESELVSFYSKLAQQKDRNPSDDVWIFGADMFDKGWGDDQISELFAKHCDKIVNYLMDRSRGVGDYYLYNCSKKQFPLGGYTLKYCDDGDILMKYYYGWQRNKYGKLFIEQSTSVESFLEMVAQSFYLEDIYDGLILTLLDKKVSSKKYDFYKEKFKKLIKIDGNTIEIPYKRVTNSINTINFIEGDAEDEDVITAESTKNRIISHINKYKSIKYEIKSDSIYCEFLA